MKIKTLTIIGSAILLALLISTSVCAYTIDQNLRPINEPFSLNYSTTSETVKGSTATIIILQTLAGALLYFAAPLAIIILGLAAFNLTMGGAESEKRDMAKKQITWAIIGLILIMLSYAAARFVIQFASTAANLPPPPPAQTQTTPPPA